MFVRGAHGGRFAVATASRRVGDREGEALTSSRVESTRLDWRQKDHARQLITKHLLRLALFRAYGNT